MNRLIWPSITKRLEGRRIVDLWYDVEDGYLELRLDDGSVLLPRVVGSSTPAPPQPATKRHRHVVQAIRTLSAMEPEIGRPTASPAGRVSDSHFAQLAGLHIVNEASYRDGAGRPGVRLHLLDLLSYVLLEI